jgi:hypothetical protein
MSCVPSFNWCPSINGIPEKGSGSATCGTDRRSHSVEILDLAPLRLWNIPWFFRGGFNLAAAFLSRLTFSGRSEPQPTISGPSKQCSAQFCATVPL